MIVVFLGPPGSGKGTQASLFEKKDGFKRISTGDLLRKEIERATPLGLSIQAIVEEGGFPSNEVLYLLLDKMMQSADGSFLFDGFPRTIDQAVYFDDYLLEKGLVIDHVIFFDITDEALVKRLSGRHICGECGATYNSVSQPPSVHNKCDVCGSKDLIRRKDDDPISVRQRLKVYHQKTELLKDFYAGKGIIKRVDALQDSQSVYREVKNVISFPNEIRTAP